MENKKITKEEKIKVFLADNENNAGLSSELENSGRVNIVGTAGEGQAVLDSLKDKEVDVLILEAMLSGVDGFKVLEQVKKYHPHIKVIMVSSLSHSGFINKALQDGANYYMVKPYTKEGLLERIEDVCRLDKKSNVSLNKQLDEKISNIFITIGIPAHIKGYQFLREAVKLAIEEPEIIGSITKRLYPTIAERFDTSSSKVERGMRHAIEVAWNRGKIENINSIFGLKIYNSNEKPTNGELIALIADKMLLENY